MVSLGSTRYAPALAMAWFLLAAIHFISTLGPGPMCSAMQRNKITQILIRNSWKRRISSVHRSTASSSVKNIGLCLVFCPPNIFCFHTHLLLLMFLSFTATQCEGLVASGAKLISSTDFSSLHLNDSNSLKWNSTHRGVEHSHLFHLC